MALKFKYKAKEEIPAEHLNFYVERDGAFVLDAGQVINARPLLRTDSIALDWRIHFRFRLALFRH